MAQFVRFRIDDEGRFQALRTLFYEVKRDKEAEEGREPTEWVQYIPDAVKPRFHWPTDQELQDWQQRRDSTPIAISPPWRQIGKTWRFYRIFEAFEYGEYDLLSCEMTSNDTAEMQIDAFSYPYGGLGCMIALAEAFGFEVLGVNEYGRYESREELIGVRQSKRPQKRRLGKPWKRPA